MLFTATEFENKKDQLLIKYAGFWHKNMQEKVWLSNPTSTINGKLLWLFVFVLNNYEHSATATNYITEQQLADIFSKANSI